MKKIPVIAFLVVFFLLTLVACSSTRNVCPAYSNSATEQSSQQNG